MPTDQLTYLQKTKMNSHKVWHGGTVDGERETKLWANLVSDGYMK